jgi:hypothetical protein
MSDMLIENVPMVLDAGFQASSYRWTLNKVTLPGATNRVLVLESPQEGDAGIYAVFGDDDVVQYRLAFRRAVRVLVNGADVQGDRVRIGGPATVTLLPYLSGLPVRYTLDGTEPTAVSNLYRKPFPVTNSVVLRAAIIIPEGDSVRIIK